MHRLFQKLEQKIDRRNFLTQTSLGLGTMALGSLLGSSTFGQQSTSPLQISPSEMLLNNLPHFAPKAKRVVYLFMSGGPSQLDLFDYKPYLEKMHGQALPDSIRKGQRLTGMSAGQSLLATTASKFKFQQHGQS
ncbi:MAG: DUF1501 domain-containing protein, partial [Bacteroidota bacterium]